MKFSLITNEDFRNITVYSNGELLVASNEHPAFERIVAGAIAGDESIVSLFDVSKAVAQAFDKVSERVSLRGGVVFLDNEEVDGSLTDQIVRFYEDGLDFKPLVLFLENIANNPSDHSRKQLYDWLRNRNFTIDDKGHIVAYKGVVAVTDGSETKYTSVSQGFAIVDGVEHNGAIPNAVGSVVEMPRTQVTWNPNVSCNTGLHAGTWRYAKNFAQGAVLTVSINPRDVVSVPHDSSSEKIRVCRYTVTDVVEDEHKTSYYDYSINVTDDKIDDLEPEDHVEEIEDDLSYEEMYQGESPDLTSADLGFNALDDDTDEDDEDWDEDEDDEEEDDVDQELTVTDVTKSTSSTFNSLYSF